MGLYFIKKDLLVIASLYRSIYGVYFIESFLVSSLCVLVYFIFLGTLVRNHGLHCLTQSRGHS